MIAREEKQLARFGMAFLRCKVQCRGSLGRSCFKLRASLEQEAQAGRVTNVSGMVRSCPAAGVRQRMVCAARQK
jgi:hypothetical protein